MTPEEILQNFERPSKHISDIECPLEAEALPTGFHFLTTQKYIRAKRPDLLVFAARPGHGKSAWACQLAWEIGKTSPVLFFSLEMTGGSLKERILALEANQPINDLSKMPSSRIKELNDSLGQGHLYIDDTPGLTINEIISRTLTCHQTTPLELVIIDYIQIIGGITARAKNEEIALIAEKLKTLAKTLSRPVLCLAQSNRNIEGRSSYIDYKSGELKYATNGRPMMSDLADSAGIEKWSDFVAFLQRPYLVDRTRPGEIDFFVVKNRNGAAEDFKLRFEPQKTKFSNPPEEL